MFVGEIWMIDESMVVFAKPEGGRGGGGGGGGGGDGHFGGKLLPSR